MKVAILKLPLCVLFAAGLCCVPAQAQSILFRSSSQQFTARQLKNPNVATSARTKPSANSKESTLDPALLVAECEQLKGRLLAELGEVDNWRGRIDLIINPSLAENSDPQLTAVSRPQGWTYELVLPKRVKHEILMRKLFQTMFLEMANRHGGVQSADVPLWLVEGMSAHLEANSLVSFMLQPGQAVSRSVIWNRNSQTMPAELRQHPALSFQQLSWPDESDVAPEGLPLYRSCAELFLEGLLKFEDGKACLRSMIDQLPGHWNWQTAFLLAFHGHFEQLLDVEKWWSVNYIDAVKGYREQAWSADDSRRSLQSTLDVPIEVHFETNRMPVEARVTLQEVIQKWQPKEARDAIQRTINGLKFLEPRASGQWRALSQLYLKTLVQYLKDSETAKRQPPMGMHTPPLAKMAYDDVIRQLNSLDQQREALWTSVVSTNRPQLISPTGPSQKPVAVH